MTRSLQPIRLPEPDRVPGLQEVADAFREAQLRDVEGGTRYVAYVTDAQHVPVCRLELRGFEALAHFNAAMTGLGYLPRRERFADEKVSVIVYRRDLELRVITRT